jgi:hypothetical protein
MERIKKWSYFYDLDIFFVAAKVVVAEGCIGAPYADIS